MKALTLIVALLLPLIYGNSKKNTPIDKWHHIHNVIEHSNVDSLKVKFSNEVINLKLKTDATNCNDGNYSSSSPADDFGYRHIVAITIKSGKIKTIHYDEVPKEGYSKRNDDVYNQEMGTLGTEARKAFALYEEQLLKKQCLKKVDAVTGATYSLYRFKMVVAKALEEANQ